MNGNILSIILIIIIIWYSYVELIKLNCKKNIYMEKLLDRNYDTSNPRYINTTETILKTGDLILFKSIDNIHSLFMVNHFTHVGVVVVDKILTNGEPYLFEACPTQNMDIPHDRPNTWNNKFSKGILFAPLRERLSKYIGYTYYKPLSKSITSDMNMSFINFIFYALSNMEYDYNVLQSVLRKALCGEKCNNKTNCGEFVFLSLMHMGLINTRLWKHKTIHYLKWICNLTRLKNLYTYNPIVEIIKITV